MSLIDGPQSDHNAIVRLAARGDGVTADGRHVPFAVPGDHVDDGGRVHTGPHHAAPPCSHFRACGGCQLQHGDEKVLADFVESRVVNAAAGQGLAASEMLSVHLSLPKARRRATMHGMRVKNGAVLGFREAGSHRIINLSQCPVVTDQLFAAAQAVRGFIATHGPRWQVDVALAMSDQGVDCGLKNLPIEGLDATEAALDLARDHGLARLAIDQGYGPETVWEPLPVTITLSGAAVPMPPGAFLQATADAEARMVADAVSWLEDARVIADLFAGLGTFGFALAHRGKEGRKVLAVEADRAAHLACKSAAGSLGGRLHALHRDLFRAPLQAAELARFDAVLLDPPRAGARAQIAEIAQSTLARVLYVSCNPSSWARDGAVLSEAGFVLKRLRPVGQFRWSTHVELVSLFERST